MFQIFPAALNLVDRCGFSCARSFPIAILLLIVTSGAGFATPLPGGQVGTSDNPVNPGSGTGKQVNRQRVRNPLDKDGIPELQLAVQKAIRQAEDSVVSIVRVPRGTLEDPTSPDFIPREFGTGVAIDEQGLILTCYHLLGDPAENTYYVWRNGVPYRARRAEKVTRLVAADPWTDLAVLEIDAKLKPIRLAEDFAPRRGQFVLSLGNPAGIARDGQASASFGIISNLLRPRTLKSSELESGAGDTFSQYGTLLQTDMKLHRGTSGGPLVNLDGEMIGMTTSLTPADHYDSAAGFAIPVDTTFRRTVQRLRQGKPAEFGFLGIATRELTVAQREQFGIGVVVTQVVENTPADIGGLKFGDIITHVNEREIRSSRAMLRELSGRFAKDRIILRVHRQVFPNQPYVKMEIEVTLGKKRIRGRQPTIGINDFSSWRGIRVGFPTDVESLAELTGRIDPKGCVVLSTIEKNSPAARAGLKALDYVSHVNGKRVTNPDEFYAAVEKAKGQVELTLTTPKNSPRKILVPEK